MASTTCNSQITESSRPHDYEIHSPPLANALPEAVDRYSLNDRAQEPVSRDEVSLLSESQSGLRPPASPAYDSIQKGWRPFATRRTVIFTLTICCVVILASLEVLLEMSVHKNGIARTVESRHYLWTYGPTAVLTLLAFAWRRVHYRIRQIQPWKDMARHRGATGKESLFLDYVSLDPFSIMFYSLRFKHHVVACSTLISALLPLLIAISTGLMHLIPTPNECETEHHTTSGFSGADEGYMMGDTRYSTIQPFRVLQAIDGYGLAYPPGTTPDVSYQQISATNVSDCASISAIVDVMQFGLNCMPATLSMKFEEGYIDEEIDWGESQGRDVCVKGTYNIVTFSAGNCTFTAFAGYHNLTLSYLPLNWDISGPKTFADFGSNLCDGEDARQSDNYKILIAVGEVEHNGTTSSGATNSTKFDNCTSYSEIHVHRSQQWICDPIINLTKANLTLNQTQVASGSLPNLVVQDDAISTPLRLALANVPYHDFLEAIWEASNELADPRRTYFNDPVAPPIKVDNTRPSSAMVLKEQSGYDLNTLLGTDLYLNLSQSFFRRISAQITTKGLMTDDTGSVNGTATVPRNSLILSSTTVRFMQAILALIILQALLILALYSQKPAVPFDVSSLAGLAAILLDNPGMRQLLGWADASNVDHWKELSALIYETHFEPCSRLRLTWTRSAEDASPDTAHANNVKPGAWSPTIMHNAINIPALVAICAIIIALEITLSVSNHRNGLGTVNADSSIHLLWSYVPAFVIGILAIYQGSFAFAYQLMMQYRRLQSGSRVSRTLHNRYLQMGSAESLWTALRHREVALSIIAFATTISSFLSIIVSGVFSAEFRDVPDPVELKLSSWFRAQDSATPGEVGNNAAISALIIDANMSYPKWTYDALVLSSFEFASNSLSHSLVTTATSVSAKIPAIRSALNCTVFNQDQIHNLKRIDFGVSLSPPGPGNCTAGLTLEFEQPGELPDVTPLGSLWQNDRPGCPPLNFFWGNFQYSNDSDELSEAAWEQSFSVLNVAGMTCYETVDVVNVNVKFIGPDFVIDATAQPQADETIARLSPEFNLTFPWKDMPTPEAGLMFASLNFTDKGVLETQGTFFYRLYRYNISVEDLANSENIPKISRAIQDFWKLIRAQQYHAVFRIPLNNSNAEAIDIGGLPYSTTVQGTQSSKQTRLVQHDISTHILCGLLTVIFLCDILAGYMMNIRKILPRDPGSIAAQISLLADSNIFDAGEPGLESNKEEGNAASKSQHRITEELWRRTGITGETRLKLGWFDAGQGKGKAFTIYAESKLEDQEEGIPLIPVPGEADTVVTGRGGEDVETDEVSQVTLGQPAAINHRRDTI